MTLNKPKKFRIEISKETRGSAWCMRKFQLLIKINALSYVMLA